MKFREYLINEKFYKADRIKQRFGDYNDPTAYINVHKNPNHSEVLEVIKNFKETDPEQYKKTGEMDFVRGFFDRSTGDLYIWYGTFFHDNIERFIKKHGTPDFYHNRGFRFAWLKGDDFLTVEGEHATEFFEDLKDGKLKSTMLKNIFYAFPMVKGGQKDETGADIPNVDAGSEAWVPPIKGAEQKKEEPKAKAPQKQDTKDLAKVGDVIVFSEHTPGMANQKVGILAIIKTDHGYGKKYHYVFRAPKNAPTKYTAERILKEPSFHFIDGKENIRKANEPYASQLSTGDFIKEIIPVKEVKPKPEPKKEPNNLYTPRRDDDKGTYRAYTDRR